jgi:signal transduction histidine kinase
MVGRPDTAYAAGMISEDPDRGGRAHPRLARLAWHEPPAAGGPLRPPARDVLVAALVTVAALAGSYGEAHPSEPSSYFTPPHHLPHTPDAALLVVAAAGAVLAWRRRYPRLVVAATTLLVVAYTLPGYVNGTAILLPALALGLLATRTPAVRAAAWAVAVTVAVMAATAPVNPLGWSGGSFLLIPTVNAAALFAGIAIASRRAYVESLQLQAARRAELEAQRRVGEERLRIARELHDAVAHTMATITVQAAAASQLLGDRPDDAAASLRAIRAAGKDGLRELRAILDVLRTVDSAGAGESGDGERGAGGGCADPVQPVPGLSRLADLAAGVRAAGLPVTVTVTGEPRELAAVTGQSAFRIVQEALTNALRHAGPATAVIAVDYGADALRVTVTDTGRGPAEPGGGPNGPAAGPAGPGSGAVPGHGLRGMRERAAAAGGTVEAGPGPRGGFLVSARLPLDDPRAETEPGAARPGPDRAAGSADDPARGVPR